MNSIIIVQNSAASESSDNLISISQLSDVQPSDWAFTAFQSLVEPYGVISAYPDSTFQGERYLTRYEFSARLQAVMHKINELNY
ncbi:S-layer homology domain-containing protein [Trichormus azollae]|uniref:S-layer homology domain-containing protein n=1 Tax=Trichormus azollae TaxID=1164 RepID=UPI00325C418E